MGCCILQVFETFLPIRTNSVSEIVDPAQMIFRKRIAILCRLLEVEDGLFDILLAFFLEIDLSSNIGAKCDAVLC